MPDPTPLSILQNCLAAKDAAEQAASAAITANASAQDAATSVATYTPATPSDWENLAPATLTEAVNRLAAKLKSMTSTGA